MPLVLCLLGFSEYFGHGTVRHGTPTLDMQSTVAIASLCPRRHASRARIHRLRELINLTDAGVVACVQSATSMLSITLAGQDGHVPALRVCLYAANCMHEACCEVRVSAMMHACRREERGEREGLGILETGGQATRNMNLDKCTRYRILPRREKRTKGDAMLLPALL